MDTTSTRQQECPFHAAGQTWTGSRNRCAVSLSARSASDSSCMMSATLHDIIAALFHSVSGTNSSRMPASLFATRSR